MRCEGYRRRGGAFTLGPVTWEQCKNDATMKITVVQDKEETFPACVECLNECLSFGIEVKSVVSLEVKPASKRSKKGKSK